MTMGLTRLGHTKDSLWSIDLFRCESILLKSHWVLVAMDQFTMRIIGFGVHPGDGCSTLSQLGQRSAIPVSPRQANLRILEIRKIKSIPYLAKS
jgi:putative transposase